MAKRSHRTHLPAEPRIPKASALWFARTAWIFQLVSLVAVDLAILLGVEYHVAAISSVPAVGLAVVGAAPYPLAYAGYRWSYRTIEKGGFAEARFPTLLLGVLGIFFGAVITGVLYFAGYIRLGETLSRARVE